MQILIVEDEDKIAAVIKKGLQEQHYTIDTASDGEEALYKCSINEYDMVILDIMLPKIDGITVCKKIRETNKNIPILMLTARDDTEDKISGLDAGADDYVAKPFSFAELSARIRALLRRGNKADPVILRVGDIALDPASKKVTRDNKLVILTAREYALLEYFMRNPNKILSKTQLLEHVWDYNYEGFSNVVEAYVKYLRNKLRVNKHEKDVIQTIRGLGYKMG